MKWRRLGRIFCPDGSSDWMHSHAMIPIAESRGADVFRIYFSPRDRYNRGHGAWLEVDMRAPTNVLRVHDKPILSPGALGCFDDSGALPNAIMEQNGRKLLYYTGINVGVTVSIRNSIGLAEWNAESETFERLYQGPVIDRTRDLPHFVATPEVKIENGRFRAWFTRCVRWERRGDGVRHYYNLEYAESADGIVWDRSGRTAVDFRDRHEYALGVPRVLAKGEGYEMFFCSRATETVPTYRLRHAISADGVTWDRRDGEIGIDVAEEGWDSEMLCYPYVFDHGGERYLLYNGNGYGRTGFGIAKLEKD